MSGGALGVVDGVKPRDVEVQERPEPERGPLVPWSIGKCALCGSTLCLDPLPHRCGKAYSRKDDPDRLEAL